MPVQGYVMKITGIIWTEGHSFTEYHLNSVLTRMLWASYTRRGLPFRITPRSKRGGKGEGDRRNIRKQSDRDRQTGWDR